MSGNGSATAAQADGDVRHVAVALADKAEYGTLVLDSLGRIRNCGAAAGRLLGCSLADLMGKSISEFVANFSLSNSSRSYSSRYIAHLCAHGGWRKFSARDTRGQEFPVELSLSRIRADGQDFLLLNLRRL